MTPEQLQQLNELLAWKRSLESSSSIPLKVDQSFRERFNINGIDDKLEAQAVGTYTLAGIERTISLTGDPQDIEVLEYPTGYVQVEIDGTQYKLAYFND